MGRDTYQDAPGIRRSDLWKINRSPAHFKFAMENETGSTPALRFGIAAHKMMLEPFEFFDEVAVSPDVDRRTKEGKTIWQNWMEANEDKTHITQDELSQIHDMEAALQRNRLAVDLLTGIHEQEFYWTDQVTGEKCKCKCDCLTNYNGRNYIVDYKTTESCEPGAFERSCRKYGYKFQAGMYTEGVFANTFDEYGFAFVAQEKNPPYSVRVYFCTDEFIAEGQDQFRDLIGLYHECKETDTWPGYDHDGKEYATLYGDDE